MILYVIIDINSYKLIKYCVYWKKSDFLFWIIEAFKKYNKKIKKLLTKSCKRGILLLVHQRNIFEASNRTLAIK